MTQVRTDKTVPTPVARRLVKPSWRDTRLLIGVFLVLASVVAGAKIVAAADDTAPMYAAAHELVPGAPISAADLTPVDVNLGSRSDGYLAASSGLPVGQVLTRAVRAGELVPKTALAPSSQNDLKPVMVPVTTDVASVLVSGSVVDVWINPKLAGSGDEYGTPVKALTSASVARVDNSGTGALAGTKSTVGVQIMVPTADVQKVISAVDQGAKVTLVPAAGSPAAAL